MSAVFFDIEGRFPRGLVRGPTFIQEGSKGVSGTAIGENAQPIGAIKIGFCQNTTLTIRGHREYSS